MNSIGVVGVSLVVGVVIGAVLFFRPAMETAPIPDEAIGRLATAPGGTAGLSHQGEPVATGSDAATHRLTELEGRLQQEKAAREALAMDVAALKREMASLGLHSISPAGSTPSSADVVELQSQPNAPRHGEDIVRTMASLGVPQETAESFRRRNDQLSLARLQLHDRAGREGWSNTSRFRDENQDLDRQENQLRKEIGEDVYDRFLFASGQDNRVRVEDVMLESPAAAAGLQLGDVILAYDKKRVFSWPELRDAISEGQSGEQVPVTIQRGDEIRDVYLSRGPMGVQLETIRLAPDAATK